MPVERRQGSPEGTLYRFHWRSGKPSEMRSAIGPEDAFTRLGYGAGAVGALDYWERVKELPPTAGEK